MPAQAVQQTQEMRSARTRRKILEATLDSIYEDGFQKASTNEIARRAGVSRGALLHHYPIKELLIADAVEYLLTNEIADIRRVAGAYATKQLTIDDFIDDLWRRFSGRLFMITVEFLASARSDEKLCRAIGPVSLRFHQSLNEIWSTFFANKSIPPHKVQVLLNATTCLMRGMGIQTIFRDDPDYYQGMLTAWREVLRGLLDEEPEPPASETRKQP
jgi:AcrR family transcriptional regulator